VVQEVEENFTAIKKEFSELKNTCLDKPIQVCYRSIINIHVGVLLV